LDVELGGQKLSPEHVRGSCWPASTRRGAPSAPACGTWPRTRRTVAGWSTSPSSCRRPSRSCCGPTPP
jgi:hypothetical protein